MTSSLPLPWKLLLHLFLLLLVAGTTTLAFVPPLHHCYPPRTSSSSVQVVGLAAAAPRLSPQEEQQQPDRQSLLQAEGPLTFQDSLREFFLSVTRLSLRDYEWRSTAFRSAEADRQMEESLARIEGKERMYLRPADAPDEKIGPLGRLEKTVVEWLSAAIEEEGRRAKKILSQDGKLVRPIESASTLDELGPLGYLEKQVSDLFGAIRRSEEERVRTNTLQPSKLPDDVRGPLGFLEKKVSDFWAAVRQSELLRAEQSRLRGGEMVRPIDVPGPLGEWEMKVADIMRAEERRAEERNQNEGRVVRPKDASFRGPLGELEQAMYDFFGQLQAEESDRLQSIQQLMQDKRPMENDRKSVLGVSEAVVVGVLRAPQLIVSVFQRVLELLNSESLPPADKEVLQSADPKSSKK